MRCPTFISMEAKLFFAATVALITVSLFAWIIKWFYHPKAYKDNLNTLFPAQRWTGFLFLLQVLEAPYLFDIDNDIVLRYTNAFSMLLAPPVMLIICRKFFFPSRPFRKREITMFVPTMILFVVFLLRAMGVLVLEQTGKAVVIYSALAVFLYFFYLTLRMAQDIWHVGNNIEMQEYSDIQDYTRSFANYVLWIPTFLCIMLATNYIIHDPWVKFASDVISIIGTIIFVMYTLDPWHEVEFVQEQHVMEDAEQAAESKSKRRMSDSRYEQLRDKLVKLFDEKQIFLTPHLSLDMLLKELTTNRNYLCETIARSGYKSFYDMVNSYRVKYAIELIKNEPQAKMVDIADRSGFASAASMNKAFTQQGLPTPSKHRSE